MRQLILAANWKMHKTVDDAEYFLKHLGQEAMEISGLEVVLCPAFTALYPLSRLIGNTPFTLGAQNMHWEREGAYTGEVSPLMLRELGVRYVILGHSERRRRFQEKSREIGLKLSSAFNFGLNPILCVGETEEERLQGLTKKVLSEQLEEALGESFPAPVENAARLTIAYEPVWAIGTGRAASSDDAKDAAAIIRSFLFDLLGERADRVRIQYGGSVDSSNIVDFVSLPDIDGALVGGASLKPNSFLDLLLALDRLRRS